MSQPVFRFAPSPNGYLHLGHALSALLNYDLAKRTGGTLLLRIEDIDATRCKPEFETAIYEDLAWLGIQWSEPVRKQSEHFADYRTALDRLDAMGVIYPSFESRAEVARLVAARGADWPHDPDGAPLYPGHRNELTADECAARMASGEPFAWRLDMEAAIARCGPLTWSEEDSFQSKTTVEAQPQDWGDVVLARKDVPTSYHLSVVIDDALQGITDVTRGQDLFWSTSVHRVLQALLGLSPPRYHHHRLIMDETGAKLSKSTQATALRELRGQGVSASGLRSMLRDPR